MIHSPVELMKSGKPVTLSGVADGAEGLVVADLARAVAAGRDAPAVSLLVVCRDGQRLAALARGLAFFAPEIERLEFPAWDCLPYDRVSPHAGVLAQRMTTLSRLANVEARDKPAVVLTTVNAILQRVPPRTMVMGQSLSAAPGNVLPMERVASWLELNGYTRASTVREPGDYAVRGASSTCMRRAWASRCGSTSSATRSKPSAPSIRKRSEPNTICVRSIWCRCPNFSSPRRRSASSGSVTWRPSARRHATTSCTKR
jgi:hypothetical protein